MSRFTGIILSSAFLIVLSESVWGSPPTDRNTKLKIGAILTLSGNFAAAGDDARRGIEAALSESDNANWLEVRYEDSRNEPSVAVAEFQKLVNVDGAAAIYTHRSSIGMALNPISLRGAVPLLGAVGHQEFATGNKFAIQMWPRAHDEGRFVADEFFGKRLKRIAVLWTEDEWTGSVTEGFRGRLKELGVEPVFDQSVLPGERDLRTQLLKLKASAPDVVYFNFLLPQIAPALTQARALDVPGVFFSNFYLAKHEIRDSVGMQALEGVRYVEFDNELPHLKAKLGRDEPPPGLAVASYVSTLLLAQAAKAQSKPGTAEEFAESVLRQKEVRTPDGNYLIEDRCVRFPLVVKVFRGGTFIKEVEALTPTR